MNLLARGDSHWSVRKLEPAENARMHDPPDMSKVDFSARVLIEGLIAHGIVRPGDVKVLLDSLAIHAVVPAFRDRILESLYNVERVRNVAAIVRGESNTYHSTDRSLGKASYLRHIEPPKFSHLVIVRTVLVTPTRLLVSPPQQEPSNTVTRRYANRLDGIIRVIFSDEEDRLHVCHAHLLSMILMSTR